MGECFYKPPIMVDYRKKIPVVNHIFYTGEPFEMNIYLEIFGYIGTALVIVSMMMTSVLKLRIINMCGGLISLIYAVCVNTWPVVVLNACLITINFVQTVRALRGRDEVTLVKVGENDPTARHLLGIWQNDFEKQYPDCNLQEIKGSSTHILYVGHEAIGFSVSTEKKETQDSDILYLAPAYRTSAMTVQATSKLAKQI